MHSGLNEIAEANNLIILYPQASVSKIYPYNPKGCWDWWGYDDIQVTPVTYWYGTKQGRQIKTIG